MWFRCATPTQPHRSNPSQRERSCLASRKRILGVDLPGEDEIKLVESIAKKRERLSSVRKSSPPNGTPASVRQEGRILGEIADEQAVLENLREQRRAREAEQAASPKGASHEWLKQVVPPLASAIVAFLASGYVKKDDFDAKLSAQHQTIATLTKKLDDEEKSRIRLERCFAQYVDHGKTFEVVSLAGLLKLGIEIRGQYKEVREVDWNSGSLGDPNAGKLPTFVPRDGNRNEIQVPAFLCKDR